MGPPPKVTRLWVCFCKVTLGQIFKKIFIIYLHLRNQGKSLDIGEKLRAIGSKKLKFEILHKVCFSIQIKLEGKQKNKKRRLKSKSNFFFFFPHRKLTHIKEQAIVLCWKHSDLIFTRNNNAPIPSCSLFFKTERYI